MRRASSLASVTHPIFLQVPFGCAPPAHRFSTLVRGDYRTDEIRLLSEQFERAGFVRVRGRRIPDGVREHDGGESPGGGRGRKTARED